MSDHAEAERPARIKLTLSPEAARYARRDAPVETRRMAARGALPLPPPELAAVLFALLHDPDQDVKDTARASLEGLPDNLLDSVISAPTPAPVLSYLARCNHEDAARLEKLALNPATDDSTIAFLAAQPHRRVVELIAQNQERILRAPEIVDALGSNPLTSRSVIERIVGFLGYEGQRPGSEADGDGQEGIPSEISDDDAEAALRAFLGEDGAQFARELVEDGAADEASAKSLMNLVAGLSVVQKVRLALLGNKEARSILVRDSNKIVASAAIRSPRIREEEVLSIAKSRGVCDEVLRVISDNREWTRGYAVKLALVGNPKTPQPKAMHFMGHLQERDLRQVSRSKDVPSAIVAHARRLLAKRTAGR